jgi:hypothetical protein
MNSPLKYAISLALGVVLSGSLVFGDVTAVHRKITEKASDCTLIYSSAYGAFLDTISLDEFTGADARKYLSEGSEREDDPVTQLSAQDAGGFRSFNHFYDPLDPTYGKGLSDFPPDFRVRKGTNSFKWASISNSPGLPSGLLATSVPTNIWSWQNARYYEWLSLTASNRSDRKASLTNLFRAVGQVMHLLQDTSQPQHARNEQHLEVFVTEPLSTPWRSPIEDYGKAHVNTLNYELGILEWREAGFTKLEDFWDRHIYHGTNPEVLTAETNGGTSTLGLAEWCNGNFLGARHLYPEYYPTKTNDIKYYPYPSRDSSTDYLEKKSHLSSAVHGFTLKNGEPAQAIYLQKTGDGEHMAFHSRFTYFGAKVPYFGMITINDDNVLSNYHALFIPKAVKYSAGLIDYYFRGNLDTMLTGSTNGTYLFDIQNTSGQDLKDGVFRLFYDDTNGMRTELTGTNFSTNYSGTLAAGGILHSSFAPSTNADRYVLLYQGTIGTTGGTALDPVDSGIAIATKSFKVLGSLNFNDLVWSAPSSNPGTGGTAVASATNNHASAACFDATDFSAASSMINGSLNYAGPAVNCNMHIVVSYSPGASSGASYEVSVSQDGNIIGVFGSAPPVSGTYGVPFTVLATADSVISVFTACDVSANDATSPASISITATLTPAF